jgi:hypothetical protein
MLLMLVNVVNEIILLKAVLNTLWLLTSVQYIVNTVDLALPVHTRLGQKCRPTTPKSLVTSEGSWGP